MATEADLRAALATAFEHLRPGGVAVFEPDYVRETFAVRTDLGGHDAPSGRGLRYLEWVIDPDPTDSTYQVDYAVLMREPPASGSKPTGVEDPEDRIIFVGTRPNG